jgi:DNA gyrase/topoisomerase IV subunit A
MLYYIKFLNPVAEEGDALKWARICKPDDEVVIATKDGFATRFLSSDIITTSRTARGVRALSLRPDDRMTDMDILKSNRTLVIPGQGEWMGEGGGYR